MSACFDRMVVQSVRYISKSWFHKIVSSQNRSLLYFSTTKQPHFPDFKMQFSLLLLSLVGLGNAIELPKPNGPYSVAVRTHAMIEKHRIDPYDPKRGHRNVLASIFWPVASLSCSETTIPYMTPAVAKLYGQKAHSMGLSNETFAAFEYSVCTPADTLKGCGSKKRFPLIIFSPGAGNSRLLYSNMARSFASLGNVVALIDHPYDAVPVIKLYR